MLWVKNIWKKYMQTEKEKMLEAVHEFEQRMLFHVIEHGSVKKYIDYLSKEEHKKWVLKQNKVT